jgi:flagellar hook-associated protein 2
MAGIQLSGLASGLDTESMITQLMAVERAPRTRLTLQKAAAQARQDALNNINGKLQTLKLAADALGSVGTWAPTQSVAVSDDAQASARVTGGAGPGTYKVVVSQLASADQRTYNYNASGATRTVTLNGKSLTIAANASVDDIAAQINADTSYGVYAVNANNRLVLAARTTGAASAISMTGSGGVLTEDATVRKQGVDASYTLDGRSYTSASNVITGTSAPAGGFIPGVELTLKAASNTAYNVTVSNPAPDAKAISDKMKAFVDAYNDAMKTMKSSIEEKVVPNATTDLDARKGALFADPTVRSIMDRLRNLTGAFKGTTGSTSYDEMFEVGVSTGAATGSATFSQASVDGQLTFDSAKFQAAMDANPLAVQKLLGAVSGTPGFTQSYDSTMDPYSQAGGIVSQSLDAAQSRISMLDDSIKRMDDRLAMKEQSLRTMFSNLEIALQKSRSQSADLLSSLPSLSNNG